MLRRHWLVGIFCASLGTSIGCQGSFESADVNDTNASSNVAGSPSLRALRFGIWGHRLTGTGGTTGVSSGAAGAAPVTGTGGATGGQSGGTSGTVSPATGGATGSQSGGTSGTVSPATGGATGSQSGSTPGTGGAASAPGTGGTAVTATGGSTGGAGSCGNGKLDSGEFCDGSAMQSATCAQLGFSGGSLACSSSCQFDVSSCTGGTITPTVTASRSSCAAPCAVFFDATTSSGLSSGDYVGASWNWDFNDPASPHEGTIGFNVAHVFDRPGTYHVTTRVRDVAGNVGKTSTTITVSAMSGTTYYVASSGSDSANGLTTSTPFLTLAHALSVGGGTNNSILMRRGDTFPTGSSNKSLTETGPFLLGAYVDPGHVSAAAPILSSTSTGGIFGADGTDMRFTDLHIVFSGGGYGGIISSVAGTNTLVERIELEGSVNTGAGVLAASSNGPNWFVFDCSLHDNGGYAFFGSSSIHFAMVGTSVLRLANTNDHHVIRIQGANPLGSAPQATGTYIAENTFIPLSPSANNGFNSVTMRGDNANEVVVNNYIATVLQNEDGQNMLIEGNTNIVQGGNAVLIESKNTVFRNNLITGLPDGGPDTGVIVMPGGLRPTNWVDNVVLNNNTQYVYHSGSYTNLTFLVQHSATTGSLKANNNILSTGANTTYSSIYDTDSAGTDSYDYNLIYCPNAGGPLYWPNVGTHGINNQDPMFVSTTVGAATAFRLQAASPARNIGTPAADYQDPSDLLRAKESDLGAYEYNP
jgi:hypothetical protein